MLFEIKVVMNDVIDFLFLEDFFIVKDTRGIVYINFNVNIIY